MYFHSLSSVAGIGSGDEAEEEMAGSRKGNVFVGEAAGEAATT